MNPTLLQAVEDLDPQVIATIAAVIAGPVVLSIIGSVLFALFVVFAILISSGSSQGKSAATPPASAQPAGPEHAPR